MECSSAVHGQPRTNTFHHPERFLHNQDDDDEPD
ncbi:REP13E12 repeat-containing protein [Mycobacterium tuberculosis SUMu002]|nr:REP13E12 repeat-containing protein [Mycobacterium tuberculosis SUMu002]EFP17855.1 REP13E12 repeat-containing protein [Mycobacterium tuberculosis SUMu003]EFP21694.1 hypothetical protein TMDG_03224 [Mycobacterium tuberculosis SUMu004]EFP25326.1 hypothetical protein TMEG_03862 [Mycobacterium tuberculosis SUMu005]EFP29204.1 hypothetical protein TMFG_03045 [Mycobacterium tuberculosis SUMu006]EFP33068.1 REP13E12 repeat-containing protein [Mycobacterium tuberculosis SUMu007]EFP36997.1 hypothetica